MTTFPQYKLEDLEKMRYEDYTHLLTLAESASIMFHGLDVDVFAPLQAQAQAQHPEQG